MLSRTAASLYWLGRYIERAEFTAQLVEATLRLDQLAARPAGSEAWSSALAVATATASFEATGAPLQPADVAQYLLLAAANPGSIRSCIDAARHNARAVRTALSREAWLSINRAWISVRGHQHLRDSERILNLIEEVKADARGFEGALNRMLHNEARAFIALGTAVERANGTARLLDVKYHLLLPQGEAVGGAVDRDQWTGILRTVSAVTAYRWLYRQGLRPWLVADFLILRDELPRSLMASMERIVTLLNRIGQRTGMQGEADRLARRQRGAMRGTSIDSLFQGGLHEYLGRFIGDIADLDRAISQQFRFT
ncbi:alpha-E domain-containing protein [Sphingomonas beigongshangi]|uniref:alpha-E domain-containing protein n=1 Tax=Sphingomonas beigongshangi TaxID=2782540 RepID=UPI00193BC9B7|nr:alpha-E domain-containing protein [Sphingomonas beigongshangi]